ncbi:hypothetical protein PsAD13_01421 [Pseudovibrio sp. Ad13]|uniref:hypothetical protein n=1 Tax=Pseudovibrio sp. Ad13 TaxID=989396 RepID=UPI0007AE8C4A|nr:hypothetical protein [Pseudovibrio sp. Ad13]KZK84888.1 hypothetical protein PsAD13_01421 [Pseudovibrio sp. Ad13]
MVKGKGRPRALRYASKATRTVIHRTASAAALIGPLEPGLQITGLTAGQFSAIDAMEHMVSELGPADVRISTWTTGIYDVERTRQIQMEGRIKNIRVLLDRGTFEKSPKFAGPLIEKLGVDAFRCLSVHAKVVIVSGKCGQAVMRSSMNLNKNLRTEQFDIDVDDKVTAFYTSWFDALWEQSARSQDNKAIIQAVYDRYIEASEEQKVKHTSPQQRPEQDVTVSLDEIEQLWT